MEKWAGVQATKLAEFDQLERRAPFAAFVKLGEALALAPTALEREEFARVIKTRASSAPASLAASEALARWNKAMRIVSVGSEFELDEIILVLTLRIQLALVIEILHRLGIDTTTMFRIAPLDRKIQDLAREECNKAEFARALASLAHHWHIPIADEWTETSPAVDG